MLCLMNRNKICRDSTNYETNRPKKVNKRVYVNEEGDGEPVSKRFRNETHQMSKRSKDDEGLSDETASDFTFSDDTSDDEITTSDSDTHRSSDKSDGNSDNSVDSDGDNTDASSDKTGSLYLPTSSVSSSHGR